MNTDNSHVSHAADVCIVGGGMAGLCAAIASARHGAKTLLMQDRPVLGGNASSEIRMWIRGAAGTENRETGILQELELENIYRNPTMNWSVWDGVLYQAVRNEPNITLLLNCSCLGCETDGGKITSVTGWQLNSYTFHTVSADIFIDASGDSILASLSGAPCVQGREAADEYDEYAAPEVADRKTMGSSVLIQARETDHPCPFTPPEWAYTYKTDEEMNLHAHNIGSGGTNFWWIEVSGEHDTLRDAQLINEDLLKICYGVWDHLKNQEDHGLANWELEWMGFLPGKRETRRYVGAYVLNQKDLEEGTHFEDAVAFGGWTMDNHSPLGFYYKGYSSRHIQVKVPYEIPLRSLISVAVPNLLFAGRNISATHMALSSTRVMATCAVIGQAAGTAASLCVKHSCLPAEIASQHIRELQERLLDDRCFIPGITRQQKTPLSFSVSQEDSSLLTNGRERPHDGEENCVYIPEGAAFTVTLQGAASAGKRLRLALDPDFSRESISDAPEYRKFAQRCHIPEDLQPLRMPAPLLKECRVRFLADGMTLAEKEITSNRQALLFIPVPEGTQSIVLEAIHSHGGKRTGFFSVDVI